jgi:hypothetical protein
MKTARPAPAQLITALLVAALGVAPRASAARAPIAPPAECQRDRRSIENSHEQRDNDLIRWRARWSGDNCRVDLIATGEIRFNSDFTDIASISNDGTLDLTDVDGATTRRLTMRPDRSGRLVRTYYINDREQTWDDAAKRWLASLLIDLDRMTGIGIDYRFPALFASGGPRAVLDESEKMESDYARGLYLRRLLERQRLSDAEYQRVLDIAAREMRSDYETSRVLRAVAEHASFESEPVRTAYLAGVAHMSSDYERSRSLQAILTRASVSREMAHGAVRAAGTLQSDFERSRVLLAALESRALSGDDLIPVIETAARSRSDFEKSRVLLAVAGKGTMNADTRKAYLRAADTIRSDYENRRVLSALVKQETR